MNNRKKILATVMTSLVIFLILGGGWTFSLYKEIGLGNTAAYIRSFSPGFYRDLRQTLFDIGVLGVTKRTGMPLMKVNFSRDDIIHLKKLYKSIDFERSNYNFYTKHNKWRKAEIEFEGKEYKIKFKSHGRAPLPDHKDGRYISLSVKLSKGNTIRKAKRLNLIVRTKFNVINLQTLFFAKKLGIIAQKEEWIRVKINNWPERIFSLEHRLNNDFMEYTGRSSLVRLGYTSPPPKYDSHKSLTYVFPDECKTCAFPYDELRARLTVALKKEEIQKENHDLIIERYISYYDAMVKRDSKKLIQFFDQDYITTLAALHSISGFTWHGYLAINFFNFYNQADGFFYPAVSRDDYASKLNKVPPQQSAEGQLERNPLFSLLSQDDTFRQKKYKRINQIIDKYPSIEPGLKAIEDTFGLHYYFGWANSILKKFQWQFVSPLPDNLAILSAYLSEAKPKIMIRVDANSLIVEIDPHSMSAIGFNQLDIDGFEKSSGVSGPSKFSLTTIRGADTNTKYFSGRTAQVSKDGVLSLLELVKGLKFFNGLGYNSDILETHYLLKFKLDDLDGVSLTKDAFSVRMGNRITGEEILISKIKFAQGVDADDPENFTD